MLSLAASYRECATVFASHEHGFFTSSILIRVGEIDDMDLREQLIG